MTAPQDLWAAPLAKRLVDRFRSQDLTFIRISDSTYDEETGEVTTAEQLIPAAGAIVKSMKGERDGVQQGHEVEAWIDHTTVAWPISTKDQLQYLGRRWKIVSIDPTYGSGSGSAGGPRYLTTIDGKIITTLDGKAIILQGSGAPAGRITMYASKVTARAE